MKKMSKSTMTLLKEVSASRLPKIFLIAFAISGCAGLRKFPAKNIWETDMKAGVCGQYEIVDYENFKVRHVKDWPLSKCHGVFGFSTPDIPKVLDWGMDAKDYAERKCK